MPDDPDPDDRPLAFVDLDGVLADVRHRLHHLTGRRKDWDAFFDAAGQDPSHPEGKAVVDRPAPRTTRWCTSPVVPSAAGPTRSGGWRSTGSTAPTSSCGRDATDDPPRW